MNETFVKASDLYEARDKLRRAEEHSRRLRKELDAVKQTAREDAERELTTSLSRRFMANPGDTVECPGLAELTLPDNGGKVQVHVVGPGAGEQDGAISLRAWGPPDPDAHYGVHEQGGGNIQELSACFTLTPEGLVLHRLEVRDRS